MYIRTYPRLANHDIITGKKKTLYRFNGVFSWPLAVPIPPCRRFQMKQNIPIDS